MIFIGLFLFIAFIVIALNVYNSSNLNKIEEHIKNQNCQTPLYSKGTYKAFCNDKVLEVSNSFIVDLKQNSKEYKYTDIKSVKIEKLDIIINEKYKLKFKEEKNINIFYDNLKNKIKN